MCAFLLDQPLSTSNCMNMSKLLITYASHDALCKVIGGNSGWGLTPDTLTSVACSFSSEQPCSCKLAVSGLEDIH